MVGLVRVNATANMDDASSEYWQRVAQLKPRLRSHVSIQRHIFRGDLWYVIQDAITGRFNRFSPQAYQIIALMDGRLTLEEIWQRVHRQQGEDAPGQEEVITLLSQLHQAEVIQTDKRPDIADLQKRARQRRTAQIKNRLKSPLAIRIPLIDPDRFLQAGLPFVKPFLGRAALWIWLLVVVGALFQLSMHWQALSEDISDNIFSLENLLLIGLIYPCLKLLHEFAHGFMIKRFGGAVHEMGVMFLVFMPFPYVDATSCNAFTSKHQRMLVGAAGIMVELFLAALAMWIWVQAEPGLLRSVMFNVMIIAGISTLLFNGNPLLRYDAYYVLADSLEMPNMGQRANNTIGYLMKKYILRVADELPEEGKKETLFLTFYGFAAFCYRIFLTFSIALFVASQYFFVGVLLAVWSLSATLIMPAVRIVKTVWAREALQAYRSRFVSMLTLFIGLFLLLLLLIPFPYASNAEGVIWLDDSAKLRAAVAGRLEQVVAEPGQQVRAGDELIRSSSAELGLQIQALQAQLAEFEAKYQASRFVDRTASHIFGEEIVRIKSELQEANRQQAALILRSPAAGVFLLPNHLDMPGRYIARGDTLGYLVDYSRLSIRGLVAQDDIDPVRNDAQDIRIRFASVPGIELSARITQLVPAASYDLPSVALGVEGGGNIALSPGSRNQPQTFARHYQFELAVDAPLPVERIGERVYVRFAHSAEPLAYRLYRQVRRVFLRQLDL